METEVLFKKAVTEELDYAEPDKSNIIEEPKNTRKAILKAKFYSNRTLKKLILMKTW